MLGVQTITVSFRRIFLLTMQDALRFIIIQIFKRKFSGTYRGGINKYTRSLFILPVTVFILLNGFLMPVRYPYGYLLTSIGGILLIVCSIINFSVIDKLLEAENELKMNELLKLKTTLEQTHYQSLQEINKEYAAHIHDIRHILKIIQRLDETGDDEKIHEISDKVTELLKNKCPLDRKFCMEDSVINAIFMERGKKAAEGGVKFTADIQPNVELDFICDIDKIRIFGNLLDNAIEAAILCNNGYVTVSLYRGNDSIVIFRVENNFEHKNKKHGKAYITTKSDKTRHGFGLKNVKELSEKYNGIMKITEENDVFFITLILSNIQKMEI
jgi:signal transduction histidine kinase